MIARAPFLALAALALAACAQVAPDAAAPDGAAAAPAPASRFEPGGGPVRVLRLDVEGQDLVGLWEGVYTPYDPMNNDHLGAPAGWTGPISGVNALLINEVEGNIMRGRIIWTPTEGEKPASQNWTSAISHRGDARFIGSVIFLKEQDGVKFLESDLILPDGKDYLHRWVKTQ
ncbi:hypothetical protein ACQ5SO_16375 [Rhodovulum sp. DZ06]|uniref:hypothetical protein n=1 Tax=Rhodovulum sp. DZ06 TaxID=3425126 RepID=UPI003D34DF82